MLKGCAIIIALAFVAISQIVAVKIPKTCYSCEGLTCLRTLHNKTEVCLDILDFCVTVFEKSQVIRRGCFLRTSEEYRNKCELSGNIKPDCHKCNEDKCNNLNREDILCIQCDSSSDPDCKSNTARINPKRCAVSSAGNSYCYVKYENGKTIRGCSVEVAKQKYCFNDIKCMLCLSKDVEVCNRIDFDPGSVKSLFMF